MRDTGVSIALRRATAAALLVSVLGALAVASSAGADALAAYGRPSPVRTTRAAASFRTTLASRISLPALGAVSTGRVGLPVARTSAGAPCGDTGLLCSRVDVPLDRAGVVPGSISLHVEVLPSLGPSRGTVFLIAGGPGQGSAHVFGLNSASAVNLYRYLFPGYTLVAYDDRGTGDSGVLRCPELQAASSIAADAVLAASCADSLGPQRDFYSTHEHAEDLEAVRASLGVDKVALWGTSYGTKLALAYALAHPDHVERLLLDSVVPTDRDTYGTSVLKAMPNTLRGYCAGGVCRAATSDLAGDLVTVANRLAAKPVQAKVLQPNGRTKTEKMNGLALVAMTVDADLSPGLAAVLPAAVHAARSGNMKPLLRVFELDSQGSVVPDEDLSSGLYAATVCRDGPFPWQPDTPIADRPALLAAALGALPAGSLGPFGTWASQFGDAAFCLRWPVPAGGAALGPGPLPDVPVLAVSGGFDLRTPTADAAYVASRFPQAHLLVVPGVGHSVLGADLSGCSQRAVHDWMLGTNPPATCARPALITRTVPAYAASAAARGKKATPAQTLKLASQAMLDAEAIWLMIAPGQSIAGVSSGKLTAAGRGFTLTRYGVVPGIELSGKLRISGSGLPIKLEGTLTVSGSAAANGVLGVKANSLAGTLGGKIVH